MEDNHVITITLTPGQNPLIYWTGGKAHKVMVEQRGKVLWHLSSQRGFLPPITYGEVPEGVVEWDQAHPLERGIHCWITVETAYGRLRRRFER